MKTYTQQMIDVLQTLAYHGETTNTNIEFHPKQLRDILSVIVGQNREIMDLEPFYKRYTFLKDNPDFSITFTGELNLDEFIDKAIKERYE